MNNKIRKGYAYKFEELGLTKSFEYLGLSGHHIIKVRCLKCNAIFERNDDALRGRAFSLTCRNCGIKEKFSTEERERVKSKYEEKKQNYEATILELYAKGFSLRQIGCSVGFNEKTVQLKLKAAGHIVKVRRTPDRKKEAETKYKRFFSDLGHDKNFEFICYEGNKSVRVKCRQCGLETTRDTSIFKGKQSKLLCRSCGNGMVLYSPFVNEVLAYYQAGHSVKETCEKFDINKARLNDWVKLRKVTNGRTLSEINKEKAQLGAQKTIEQRKKAAVEKIEARGFEYIDGFVGFNQWVTVKCKTCGNTTERSMAGFKAGTATCLNCRRLKAEARKEENEEKKKQREAARALINPLGLSPKQLEKERKLDEVNTCTVCGKEYTPRQYMKRSGLIIYSNVGVCSKQCQRKLLKQKQKERGTYTKSDSNHYRKAVKLGLPADKGITKAKLLKRDGPLCAICGLMLVYGKDADPLGDLYWSIDHIVPLVPRDKDIVSPGHVWANVQLAHRICNSKKCNLIEVKYGNVKEDSKTA